MIIGDKIVLRDSNPKRSVKESSFASLGKQILKSIEVHNSTVTDEKHKVDPPASSAMALSHSIMRSTRGQISKSKMKSFLGKKTWREIKNIIKEQPFDEELEIIYHGMEQPNAHAFLGLAEGHWASRLAVKNCLYNTKKNRKVNARASEETRALKPAAKPQKSRKQFTKESNGSPGVAAAKKSQKSLSARLKSKSPHEPAKKIRKRKSSQGLTQVESVSREYDQRM